MAKAKTQKKKKKKKKPAGDELPGVGDIVLYTLRRKSAPVVPAIVVRPGAGVSLLAILQEEGILFREIPRAPAGKRQRGHWQVKPSAPARAAKPAAKAKPADAPKKTEPAEEAPQEDAGEAPQEEAGDEAPKEETQEDAANDAPEEDDTAEGVADSAAE